MSRCLFCYGLLSLDELKTNAGSNGYHSKCSKKFFGKKDPPTLEYTQAEIYELAERVIKSQKTVTGVQPKLSLNISSGGDENKERLTIIGLWGEYILKPQTETYLNLPENEDLTMHLAELSRIHTVKHSLIRLKTNQLAYITKRIDRNGHAKRHMEDMCQITERLTEHKYKGSYEQIARAINKYSANPGLDVINFYEIVVFCFLTGNNDMHLKNFSLLKDPKSREYTLSPAYDLLASELVVEGDDEELALTLNGKKKKISKNDFSTAMKTSGVDEKVIENIYKKFSMVIPKWDESITNSFLPEELKVEYQKMIKSKRLQLEL